ncbi:MAG TPA: DUF169 domain-containing protein [Candidatus Acidoferrales bacterium]|nr:DUF169 domain-containing protein [Candidatus Acidoferrales bacterium]
MDCKTFTREIETHVRPATFPVAVKLLRPDEPVPEKAKRPLRDMKIQIAICQAIAMARRYGWTLAVGEEDVNCVLTKTAFGLAPVTKHFTSGHLACGMYTETLEAGAKTEEATHRLPQGAYKHLLVAPAARAEFVPDALIVYGNAAQMMRLLTGALWKRGGAITSSFTGRIDCSDEVIRTMLTGDYQVILPCYGDRVFAHTEDSEMAFSLPGSKMEELVEGLQGTHKGGIRYPVPAFLRYTPQYPEHYYELERIWAAPQTNPREPAAK